ncbi:MAG: hypothetical protein IPL61_17725 [Myxococcales bacterium]|nr:hypothetical protein [Myxococcales bacterium]
MTLLAAALVTACAGSDPDRCDLGSDCPSGFCRADHTCAPDDGVDAGTDGTPGPDAPLGCQPDHDGTLTRAELPMMAGQTARFRIATDVTVDTAGQQGAGGDRAWTLAAALPGDQDVSTTLLAPTGAWWAASFPTASYAARLSIDSDLLGVMRLDDSGLALLGVVSPEAGVTRTELSYAPPVPLLPTPLGPSAAWTTSTTVTGVALGVASLYTERYQARVDAVGTMTTPFGPFPVRRIATDLTRTVGVAVTTKRTFGFAAECYGTIATISSQDYEAASEFTSAAEVWRLIP